jgi:hypothetical protein
VHLLAGPAARDSDELRVARRLLYRLAMTQALRLLPLAFAALASVATSSIEDELEFAVVSASPADGTIGLDPDRHPSLSIDYLGDPDVLHEPASSTLSLRDASGAPIPGDVEVVLRGAHTFELIYRPDTSLPSGAYTLVYKPGTNVMLSTDEAREGTYEDERAFLVGFQVGEEPPTAANSVGASANVPPR